MNIPVLYAAIVPLLWAVSVRGDSRRFPDGFLFGAASSAAQVEGAWNEDGKSESIWDRLAHFNGTDGQCGISECQTPDVAVDSYHQWRRDVQIAHEQGLQFYRFSVAWTRILPQGIGGPVNELAVKHYDNLIDELRKHNIEPMVTIYHWDLPQRLQDMGGFYNPLMEEWFAEYARVIFERFSKKVKFFISFSEPMQICKLPQPETYLGVARYLCARHVLLAHARAWHMYNKEFRASGRSEGGLGIAISGIWFEPLSDNADDVQTASDALEFENGIFVHPIFSKKGGWPASMAPRIDSASKMQRFPNSRLPDFSSREIEFIKGASDFLGLNHYTTYYVSRNDTGWPNADPSFGNDLNVNLYVKTDWKQSDSTWLFSVPHGMYKIIMRLTSKYNRPPIYITENGWSTSGGFEDDDRINYIKDYLANVLDAIGDGADVRGYAHWSLVDNFDWFSGYRHRFGLYEVNYTDPSRRCTPRQSSAYYRRIIDTRRLEDDCSDANPDNTLKKRRLTPAKCEYRYGNIKDKLNLNMIDRKYTEILL